MIQIGDGLGSGWTRSVCTTSIAVRASSAQARCIGQPQRQSRKRVSFDELPEYYFLCAGPADAVGEDSQEPESDASTDCSAEAEAHRAADAVAGLPRGGTEGRAASDGSDADGPPGAQRESDDVSLAEIEAYAEEQAMRFIPAIDQRRSRRTATASTGRTMQADGISFQITTSTLWQRRTCESIDCLPDYHWRAKLLDTPLLDLGVPFRPLEGYVVPREPHGWLWHAGKPRDPAREVRGERNPGGF